MSGEVMELRCSGRVDLRNALARIRRVKPRMAEIIWTHNQRKSDTDLPVIEVPEGTVLSIVVYSGIPFLKMASGRVVFDARSAWGNSMNVFGGDLHVVTDGRNRKVTITVEEDATDARVTTRSAERDQRLRVFDRRNRDAGPDIVEEDEGGLPVSWRAA